MPGANRQSGSCLTGGRPPHSRLVRLLAGSFVALALAAPSIALSQGASFQGLGSFPSQFPSSSATGVNAFGTVVVGTSISRVFRWVDGTMTEIAGSVGQACGPTFGVTRTPTAVNADGNVVVGVASSASFTCQTQQAWRWTPSEGMSELPGLPTVNCVVGSIRPPFARANDVNPDGSVAVGRSLRSQGSADCAVVTAQQEAVRWIGSTPTGLGFLPGDGASEAFGVNAHGEVVVGESRSGSASQAFRWTDASGMTGLGFLPGTSSSSARDVSADGNVIVGISGGFIAGTGISSGQAFRWVNGSMTGLGFLPGGTTSNALGVSADGTVVVGSGNRAVNGRSFAVRWTPADGMRSIEDLLAAAGVNITGWQLTVATAVSADGTAIVGEGIDPNGRTQAWIARFVVSPACTPASLLGDLTGEGKSDLIFRRNDGNLLLAQMDGFNAVASQLLGVVGVEWRLVAITDFNGDGRADLLFRRNDGRLALYLMNGFQVLASQTLGDVGMEWSLIGVADFDGDGKADLLFRRLDGMLALYLMNGFQVVAAQLIGAVGSEWSLVGSRDFNGDGRADLLFRRNDGLLSLYLMNGFQVVAAQTLGSVGSEWALVAVADVNGDGRADLLFRRADGMLSLYLLNGFEVMATQLLGTVGFEWTLTNVGDLNGDHRNDLLFRRDDGLFSAYLMNGFQVLAAQVLGQTGTDLTSCYGIPN